MTLDSTPQTPTPQPEVGPMEQWVHEYWFARKQDAAGYSLRFDHDAILAFAREQDQLMAAVLESNEVMRQDCREIRGGDVPDDDELRELRSAIFEAAVGMPPETKTSEWADRATVLSEAIDDYVEARILTVGAARTVRLAEAKTELAALTRQRDELLRACERAFRITHDPHVEAILETALTNARGEAAPLLEDRRDG